MNRQLKKKKKSLFINLLIILKLPVISKFFAFTWAVEGTEI